jgi:hypothetical protein
MTELVARINSNGAGMRMRGMFERATWPLRKLIWKIEEKVVWRVADALRGVPSRPRVQMPEDTVEKAAVAEAATAAELPMTSAGWPAPSATPTESPVGLSGRSWRGRLSLPKLSLPKLKGRIGAPGRDVSIVLATIAVAIGVGIGVATLVGPSGETQGTSPPANAAATPNPPTSPESETAGGPATLHGVAPDFKTSSSSETAQSNASATTDAQASPATSPTKDTNAKPSAIPPGVAENIAAMNTARDFAGAFVLYEVGETNAKVKKTFTRTATPSLARALRDRPPRLPDAVEVPTAKVQNVVLGTDKGRRVDASVSLLRLGDLSELRLTLIKRHGTWAVSEVRG